MATEPNSPLSFSGARKHPTTKLALCQHSHQPKPRQTGLPQDSAEGQSRAIESKDRREGETAPLEKGRLADVASFKEEGVPFLSEVPQGRKSRFPRLICCLGLPDLPPQVQRQTRRADLRTCCKSQRNDVFLF